MRKILLLMVLWACSYQYSFSQITTTNVAEAIASPVIVYDSLSNYPKDIRSIKGQTVLVREASESLRNYPYKRFSKTFVNEFKMHSIDGLPYNDVAGKYFHVDEVVVYPEELGWLGRDAASLRLINKEDNNDIVYFQYIEVEHKYKDVESIQAGHFPFIIVGFYEKLQRTVIGNKYLMKSQYGSNSDYITGLKVEKTDGEVWECVGLIIETKYYNLVLIMKNTKGEQIIASYDALFEGDSGRKGIYSLDEVTRYLKKFGEENFALIIKGEVKIGWTEEMVIMSWGKPEDINKSSSGDQWCYKKQYLYFNNGKLTAFN